MIIEPIYLSLKLLFNRKFTAIITNDDLFKCGSQTVAKEDKLMPWEKQNTLLNSSVNNKSLKQQKLEKKLTSKRQFEYSEDFVALTVLCYLKENIRKYKIVPEKRGQMLYSALSVQLIVILMLICMMTSIVTNE